MAKKKKSRFIREPISFVVPAKAPRTYGTFSLYEEPRVYQPLDIKGGPFFGLLRTESGFLDLYACNLDPVYQRGHVWTDDQRSRFVGYLLQGGMAPPVVINTGPSGDGVEGAEVQGQSEVIDGKQRITACVKFERGEITALLDDGRRVHRDALDQPSVTACHGVIGMTYGLVRMTQLQAMQCYLRLNAAGTVHTPEEIERVERLVAERRLDPKFAYSRGDELLFTYPEFGTPNCHPDYTAHSGQVVTVLRKLSAEERDPECGPGYKIRAVDGWTGDADESELSRPKGRKP